MNFNRTSIVRFPVYGCRPESILCTMYFLCHAPLRTRISPVLRGLSTEIGTLFTRQRSSTPHGTASTVPGYSRSPLIRSSHATHLSGPHPVLPACGRIPPCHILLRPRTVPVESAQSGWPPSLSLGGIQLQFFRRGKLLHQTQRLPPQPTSNLPHARLKLRTASMCRAITNSRSG